MSVLTATMFGDDGATKQITDHDEISDVIDAGGSLVWVDALDPTEAELTKIEQEFSLHPLAMEDVRHPGQRPKIERYDTHAYLVAYASNGDPRQLSELDMLRRRGLAGHRPPQLQGRRVRRHGRRVPAVRPHAQRAQHGRLPALHAARHGGRHLLRRARQDRGRARVDREPHLPDDSREEQALQERLLGLRRELLLFRRRVVPLRDVLQVILRQEVQPIREDVQRYFQDVLDHILRVVDTLETQRELLGNAVDAHLAVVNNNMNQIMKKMTSWGAILFGAALISGIYGMNFRQHARAALALRLLHGSRADAGA